MTTTDDHATPPPWHPGEQRLQAHYGVDDQMANVGRRVIRTFMPDQHREFYAGLPFMVVGAVDATGTPWATLLEGTPGFVTSPDPVSLEVGGVLPAGDPARAAIETGASIGLLGIELHTRRRNRVNGTISARREDGFTLAVVQSFGNCPRYIQTRDWSFAGTPRAGGGVVERAAHLTPSDRAIISTADTCFVASYVDGDDGTRAVDVSHRGGRPGFIRVEGDVLTIPDFAGNFFFNTLGNLLVNPRAGLSFVDFTRGDLLHVTGRTHIVFDGSDVASFAGAERLWRVAVEEVVRRPAALALRWAFGEFSPHLDGTGTWEAR